MNDIADAIVAERVVDVVANAIDTSEDTSEDTTINKITVGPASRPG